MHVSRSTLVSKPNFFVSVSYNAARFGAFIHVLKRASVHKFCLDGFGKLEGREEELAYTVTAMSLQGAV